MNDGVDDSVRSPKSAPGTGVRNGTGDVPAHLLKVRRARREQSERCRESGVFAQRKGNSGPTGWAQAGNRVAEQVFRR